MGFVLPFDLVIFILVADHTKANRTPRGTIMPSSLTTAQTYLLYLYKLERGEGDSKGRHPDFRRPPLDSAYAAQ